MRSTAVLAITSSEVRRLLSLDECIQAVEGALRLHGEGRTTPPGVLGIHTQRGGFHIKAGVLQLSRNYFVAKVNGNFPENRARFGLPTIQGLLVLCDAENGRPLAVMDSMEITTLRTGATTAVAARYLARKDSRVAMVCGCGIQGRVQLQALTRVLPLEQAFAYDTAKGRAAEFAGQLSRELGIPVAAVEAPGKSVRPCDVWVTCTTSRQAFLKKEDVKRGAFIAAVGADNPQKQELEPALMAGSTIVVDTLQQCATMGDLHHALKAGAVTTGQVHAELGEIIAGRKPGRTSPDPIIIFDSTGMALQDAAAAAVVYERASLEGCGIAVDFAA